LHSLARSRLRQRIVDDEKARRARIVSIALGAGSRARRLAADVRSIRRNLSTFP
jgi:hypothetical protein